MNAMTQDVQDPADLIALQSMQRLLRVQKCLDTMRVHATHLLQMNVPVSSCDCDGEWQAHWNRLHHATQRAQDSFVVSLESLAKLKASLPEHVSLDDPLHLQDVQPDKSLHAHFVRQSCIFKSQDIERAAHYLIELKLTKAELLEGSSKMQQGLKKFLHRLEAVRTPRKRMNLLRGEFGGSLNDFGLIDSWSPAGSDDRRTATWEETYFIIGILPGVISLFGGLVNALNDAAKDDPSDIAQAAAFSMNCSQVNASSDQVLIDLINPMLDGATGDMDEAAILHLLSCLPTSRVRSVVLSVGLNRLLFDFDGAEWDRLMQLLRHHGLVGFQSFDDDASRLFINSNAPSTLNSLSLHDIATLIQNMFKGSCGDDDEQAIIRLLSCIDCGRVRQLVARPGFSVDDFDDNVDGAEWARLKQLFRNCGIVV
jgi:hypothetical protein